MAIQRNMIVHSFFVVGTNNIHLTDNHCSIYRQCTTSKDDIIHTKYYITHMNYDIIHIKYDIIDSKYDITYGMSQSNSWNWLTGCV